MWVLLHTEELATRNEAMSREWRLKRDRAFRKRLAGEKRDPPVKMGAAKDDSGQIVVAEGDREWKKRPRRLSLTLIAHAQVFHSPAGFRRCAKPSSKRRRRTAAAPSFPFPAGWKARDGADHAGHGVRNFLASKSSPSFRGTARGAFQDCSPATCSATAPRDAISRS